MKPTTTTKMKIEEKFAFHCLFFCWGFHVVNKARANVGAKNKEWKSLFHFSEICMRWVLGDLHDFAVILCGRKFPISIKLLFSSAAKLISIKREENEKNMNLIENGKVSRKSQNFIINFSFKVPASVSFYFWTSSNQSPGRINFSFRLLPSFTMRLKSTHNNNVQKAVESERESSMLRGGNW